MSTPNNIDLAVCYERSRGKSGGFCYSACYVVRLYVRKLGNWPVLASLWRKKELGVHLDERFFGHMESDIPKHNLWKTRIHLLTLLPNLTFNITLNPSFRTPFLSTLPPLRTLQIYVLAVQTRENDWILNIFCRKILRTQCAILFHFPPSIYQLNNFISRRTPYKVVRTVQIGME
jgi:hypothetical protein